MRLGAAVLGSLGLFACLGQDVDTAILAHGGTKRFTILDQIADARERGAFLALYRQSDSRKRRNLALGFLESYPQSWLLAQAYEIAAKASIDLNDYGTALSLAEKSLRLYPENPFLLVPIANVQAKQRLFAAAERSAKDAIGYLEQFDRPASVEEKDWPSLKQSVMASSYFALGRSQATRAFASEAGKRKEGLKAAEATLQQAFDLNRDDAETAFLLGMVSWGLGERERAGGYFAEVSGKPGPLREAAQERLTELYKAMPPPPLSLRLGSVAAPYTPAQAPLPEYAGSEACLACHAREHASWKATGMGRMLRAYRPEYVMADFSKPNVMEDGNGRPAARTVLQAGKHYLEIRKPDSEWTRYPVDYVIGSKWQQAYATKLPNGSLQVFPVQYSKVLDRFVNYWKLIDAPGSERADILKFDTVVASGTYQVNCALCHTSQLSLPGGWARPADAAFHEAGVNCEMCHGPSSLHVEQMKTARAAPRRPSDPPVDFKGIGAAEYVAICSQCHLQSAQRTPEPGGAMNYTRSGAKFYRAYLSRPYVDFARIAFYKDGRFQKTTFVVESFTRSACFRKGQAHCGSCHDPHPPDAAANPASLKFRDDPDRMCLQCHSELKATQQAHTGHALTSEASRCVSCHMPKIMSSLMFQARSHQIDDVPSVEMTERFGQADSPNACLLCHRDRTVAWLRKQMALRK